MGNTASNRTVKVYNYWVPSGSSEPLQAVSPAKAPLDVIRDRLKLEPLLGTGEEIEPQALDDEGHYRRRATGWGALD